MRQAPAQCRKLLCFILLLLLASLVGCGGGGGGGASSDVVLQSVTISPSAASIPLGLTRQFSATGRYSDGSSQDISAQVTWDSSNTAAATVSTSGLATAVAVGASNISATLGSVSASASLTVDASLVNSVGGTVSGLAGSGLVLRNNGGDDLAVSGNGTFSFNGALADGQSYQVTVATQPTGPAQWCNVHGSTGSVAGADVSDIAIQCTTGLFNVVDTNQTSCYDSTTGATIPCTGTGYDADYSGTQPSYTVSADGTYVTDDNTGLIWTQTPDLDGNGTVDASDKRTQPEAVTYCAGLTTGGFDWRLPNIKELYSLMEFSGTDPSGYTGTDTSVTTPFIDPVFTPGFGDQSVERMIDGQYATTSIYVSPLGTMGGNNTMFGVNFIDGRIKGYPYDMKTFYVQCVAGNTSYGVNNFVDNGDGTVSDKATGLTWQQDDYHSSDFEDALSYCENATTGGYTSWHLPNVKELQSIVDYSRAPDSTSSAAIDPVFGATSFANEEGTTDWGYYWASTTHENYLGDGRNGTYVSFGRALGYFQDPLTHAYNFDDVHGAGAQRSNDKTNISSGASSANLGAGTFYYFGPQGDILRLDNRVRCVMEGYGS